MPLPTTPGTQPQPSRSDAWLAGVGVGPAAAVIVLATGLAYANSFSAPFVFDDLKSITDNPTIRHLWPLSDVLSPPNHVTGVVGRPIINLSFALNYALGGLNVQGYHIFNTLIHALAGLALLGVVRRTLLRPVVRAEFGTMALPIAAVTALLWVLHPLQTESVTCIVQRTESLLGLFFLLTFYAFIRSVDSPRAGAWQLLTFVLCLLGMATKEVMVAAPVLVLLYDRTFVAGSFAAAWRARWKMYLGLAATWVFLGWLITRWSQRGGVVGFGLGVSSWDYALTQCRAILLYLRLSLWPSPLVVDYGTAVVHRVGDVWLQGVVLVALVAGTFWALWRRPVLGFLAFSFFAILAPSSSIVPLISQTIAEHRMYLPLAAVVILAVAGGYRWLGSRSLFAWLVVALVAGWGTVSRNRDYRDPLTLWGVTVAEQPDNPRARMNFGTALSGLGRLDEAREQFAAAVTLSPNYAEAHYGLAGVLLQLNRPAETQTHAEQAVRLKPDFAEAHYVLGTALLQQRQLGAALAQYEAALRLKPNFPDAEHTLAGTLAMAGRTTEAMEHYEAALRLQPRNALLYQEMGNLLARGGRLEDAVTRYEAAVELDPRSLIAQFNLGHALADLHRWSEAAEHFSAAVRIRPDFADAHNFLGAALMELGRLDEAQAEIEEAVRLQPDFPRARENLDRLDALRAVGKMH